MTQESAMCKLYASEISTEVANEAVQVFRGYGYTKITQLKNFIATVSFVLLEGLLKYRK